MDDAGAAINAHGVNGMTPLLTTAGFSGNPGVVAALIEAEADIRAKDAFGKTPFFYTKYKQES